MVMKVVALYDAEVPGGCGLEGCGDVVMKAVALYDAEVPGGCAPEGCGVGNNKDAGL